MAAMAALPSLHAQTTYTWTGLSGGNWTDSTKWDANGVPVSASDAIVKFFGTTSAPNIITTDFTSAQNLVDGMQLEELILNGNGTTTGTSNRDTLTISGVLSFAGDQNKITTNAGSLIEYKLSNVSFITGLEIGGNGSTGQNRSLTISSLTGTGNVTKTGSSRITLEGGGTVTGGLLLGGTGWTTISGTTNLKYTDGITLNSGTLLFAKDSANSATNVLNLNGGTVTYTGTSGGGARTVANAIVFGGDSITMLDKNIQGGATLAFTGAVNLGTATGSESRVINIGRTNADYSDLAVTMSGVLSNGGLTKSGTARLRLSNANSTYAGATVVRQGILLVGGNVAEGVNGALGNATSAIELGDEATGSFTSTVLRTTQLLIDGAYSIDREINVNAYVKDEVEVDGTSVIGGSNTSGTASFTNTVNLNRDVILAARVGGKTQFSGLISDGAGSRAVTIGSSRLGGGGVTVLNNATGNTYDGGTTVSIGSLIVNNTSGSGTGSGAVIVNTGATFGGTGRSDGAISLDAGSRMSPGDMDNAGVSSVGTFNGGSSLTWNSDGLVGMSFNLGVDQASSDQLVLSGAFTKGTGSTFVFDFTGSTLNASFTYALVTFGSNNGFTAGDFSAINGGDGVFSLTGDTLYFGAAIPEPSTYAAFAGVLALAGAVWRKRRTN